MQLVKNVEAELLEEVDHADYEEDDGPGLIIKRVVRGPAMVIAALVRYGNHDDEADRVAEEGDELFDQGGHLLLRPLLNLPLHLLLQPHLVVIGDAARTHKSDVDLVRICALRNHDHILIWVVRIHRPNLPILQIDPKELYVGGTRSIALVIHPFN